MTEFLKLDDKFKVVERRTILSSQIEKCPFLIMDADHYRADGTCKCDCAEERRRMMTDWDYTIEDFQRAGVET